MTNQDKIKLCGIKETLSISMFLRESKGITTERVKCHLDLKEWNLHFQSSGPSSWRALQKKQS